MKVIGMDIGGTNIRIGTLDENMTLIAYQKVDQKSVLHGDSIKGIVDFVTKYKSDSEISALAIGVPAAINKERNTILNAPNVHGLNGIDMKTELEKSLPFPVYIEKDVSMLFHYDLHNFSLDHTGVIIACYIGTGIGNVISIDGKLHTGSNGVAGELGHIPVHGFDEVCNCGNHGCAETLVGGKYLSALQKKYFPDTDISQLFVKHSTHSLIQDYVKNLALPIATEINIIDPSTVILGGGVVSMEGFPKDIFEQNIRFFSRKPLPEKNLKFIYSADDGKNGVIGAGIFALETINKGVF